MDFQADCFVGFFHMPEKIVNRKNLYQLKGLSTNIKYRMKRNFGGRKIWQMAC